jgi:polar amino acid transport system substrate-binding protein
MKNKIIIAAGLIILLIILFFNSLVMLEFNQDIFDFVFNKAKLTQEDKEWLKDNSPFLYASDNNAPPLRFKNGETGEYQGIVPDYIRELSIELGIEINVKPMIWKNALESLENGNSDLCDMFPSEKRKEKFIFSEIIYYENGVLVTSKNNNEIITYKDLDGKKLAIQKGDYIEEFLNKRVENVEFYYTNDYQESLKLLINGKVDATGGDEPVLSYFIKKMNLENDYRILENPIYEMPTILAIAKDEVEFRNIINKGIILLKKKNTMLRIQQKWFGISRSIIEDNRYEILKIFIETIIGIFVIAAILTYFWNRELNTKINKGIKKENIARRDLEIIFNSLPYYFLIVDKNGKILRFNIPFAEFLNKDSGKIIGTEISEYKAFSDFNLELIRNQTLKYEYDYNKKNYSISSVVLPCFKEEQSRFLLIIEDITDEKMREQQLLHSNKIASLGQLAAGITHEIRNPIGLIRNYIYIIKNKLYSSDEELNENITGIDNALDSVNEFINNLLNFSRISCIKKEVIDLNDFFSEIEKFTIRNLEKENILLIIINKADEIYFNKESLKHIFFNLISNASDSIVSNGKIVISCKEESENLVIKVMDTGKGIKKENIDKVFNSFFTTKYPDQGTGLGLNIVFKEIERNGGEIRVESEYLDGATFVITLLEAAASTYSGLAPSV